MPELSIDSAHARRFLLSHLCLLPPRKFSGSESVRQFIRKMNCIQYDPIDIVGQNPHLVLQSRIRSYKPSMLSTLLYEQRSLVDGFDKQMSIYPTEDWPSFAYYRKRMAKRYMEAQHTAAAAKLVRWARKEIEARGPLCSLDLEDESRMDWWLTDTVRAVRIALDILFYAGETVVHHRVGTRRYFDLHTRTLPGLKSRAASFRTHEDYLEWHVYRRAGGTGLIDPTIGAEFGGLIGWQGGKIRAAIERLVKRKKLTPVFIHGLKRKPFYIRSEDLTALEAAGSEFPRSKKGAAFIAPLDNLMWDRSLLRSLFQFDYTWEVYTPEPKRRYGYYVLPVLYGDRFVARVEPVMDRSKNVLTIKNWWWEKDVATKDELMLGAVEQCLRDFARYLGADAVEAGRSIKTRAPLRGIIKRVDASIPCR